MGKLKVLVVDDSKPARDLIKKILLGYDCIIAGEAENGKEAVSFYKEFMPDLVTMDINMPEMNGLDAIKEIKKIDSSAVIITISSFYYKEKEAINSGAASFIKKPFQPAFLWQKIDFLMEKGLFEKKKEKFSFDVGPDDNENSNVNKQKIAKVHTSLNGIQNIIIPNLKIYNNESDLLNKNLTDFNSSESLKKKEIKSEVDADNELEISIRPPKGEYLNILKKEKKPVNKKIDPPILNYVDNSNNKNDSNSILKKITKLFKKREDDN